jgi:hypothetical protein
LKAFFEWLEFHNLHRLLLASLSLSLDVCQSSSFTSLSGFTALVLSATTMWPTLFVWLLRSLRTSRHGSIVAG